MQSRRCGPFQVLLVLAAVSWAGCDSRPSRSAVLHGSDDLAREDSDSCPPAPGRVEAPEQPLQSCTYALTADSATSGPDQQSANFVGVELLLFDAVGGETARLTSQFGEYAPDRDSLVVRGNVVLESADRSRRLDTEELHYLPSEDRLWSSTSSVYRRRGLEIHADSFVSDGRFENVTTWGASGQFSIGPDD